MHLSLPRLAWHSLPIYADSTIFAFESRNEAVSSDFPILNTRHFEKRVVTGGEHRAQGSRAWNGPVDGYQIKKSICGERGLKYIGVRRHVGHVSGIEVAQCGARDKSPVRGKGVVNSAIAEIREAGI